MGDVVSLHDRAKELENDYEFITDMARFAEGIATEKAIKKKYRFDAATWEKLGENDTLVELIENEKVRRIRNGNAKREKAQTLIVQAPDVLGGIMMDANQSAKHRIDSAKVLDSFAGNGPEAAPVGDRFVITINLGADSSGTDIVERYSKSIKVDADDIDPYSSPAGMIAAITKRNDEGGSGEPI